MPNENELRTRLTCAFDTLRLLPDKDDDRSRVIDELLSLAKYASSDDGKSRRRFRACDTSVAKEELAKISQRAEALAVALDDPARGVTRRCEQLAQHLEAMHAPTIAAIAAAPYIETDDGKFVGLNIAHLRIELPNVLRGNFFDRPALAKALRILAQAAQIAVPADSKDAGRDTNHFAHVIGARLADDYFALTGKVPTIIVDPGLPPRGPFLDFVTAVFSAIGIMTDPLTISRAAIAGLKKVDPLSS
jgi:hypothetical protein